MLNSVCSSSIVVANFWLWAWPPPTGIQILSGCQYSTRLGHYTCPHSSEVASTSAPEQFDMKAVMGNASWLMVAGSSCVRPHLQWRHQAYVTEIQSIQLHKYWHGHAMIMYHYNWNAINYAAVHGWLQSIFEDLIIQIPRKAFVFFILVPPFSSLNWSGLFRSWLNCDRLGKPTSVEFGMADIRYPGREIIHFFIMLCGQGLFRICSNEILKKNLLQIKNIGVMCLHVKIVGENW